jgi:hypothetical protein
MGLGPLIERLQIIRLNRAHMVPYNAFLLTDQLYLTSGIPDQTRANWNTCTRRYGEGKKLIIASYANYFRKPQR